MKIMQLSKQKSLECSGIKQRNAFIGDTMSQKNLLKQLSALTAFVIFLAGCSASSNPTTADARQSNDATFECEANESSWDCQERQSSTEVGVIVAQTGDPDYYRSLPENIRWWQIRLRGSDSSEPTLASVETPTTSATARVVETTQATASAVPSEPQVEQPRRRGLLGFLGIRMRGGNSQETALNPEPVSPSLIASSPTIVATETTAQPARVETRSIERSTQSPTGFSQNPNAERSFDTVAMTANPVPLASAQKPVAAVAPVTVRAQPAPAAFQQPRSPHNDISIDGLGRDFDYAVQLGAFTNYAHSTDFMSSYSSLDLQRVKTNSRGQTFYIVIAGTFENRQLAAAQSQMLQSTYGLADTYIRTVKSIRNVQIN